MEPHLGGYGSPPINVHGDVDVSMLGSEEHVQSLSINGNVAVENQSEINLVHATVGEDVAITISEATASSMTSAENSLEINPNSFGPSAGPPTVQNNNFIHYLNKEKDEKGLAVVDGNVRILSAEKSNTLHDTVDDDVTMQPPEMNLLIASVDDDAIIASSGVQSLGDIATFDGPHSAGPTTVQQNIVPMQPNFFVKADNESGHDEILADVAGLFSEDISNDVSLMSAAAPLENISKFYGPIVSVIQPPSGLTTTQIADLMISNFNKNNPNFDPNNVECKLADMFPEPLQTIYPDSDEDDKLREWFNQESPRSDDEESSEIDNFDDFDEYFEERIFPRVCSELNLECNAGYGDATCNSGYGGRVTRSMTRNGRAKV